MRIGLELGITPEEIDRLKDPTIGGEWTTLESAALRATDELCDTKNVQDQTWGDLSAHLSDQQCMDLVFAVGQYTLVSMALNTFGVQREPGVDGFGS